MLIVKRKVFEVLSVPLLMSSPLHSNPQPQCAFHIVTMCGCLLYNFMGKSDLLYRSRSRPIGELISTYFRISYCIRLCSMRYANLDMNQLRRRQKLCVIQFMHYDLLHYSQIDCSTSRPQLVVQSMGGVYYEAFQPISYSNKLISKH